MGNGNRLALCLHGFPEHAYSWRYQMPLLAKLGYRVWAPNLRGYGKTDSPREIPAYRLTNLLADVASLIKASGASEVIVIAHDWGAALAWELAMRKPELIQRLVVCNLPHPACFLRELAKPVQFLKSWYILFFQIPYLPEALLGFDHARLIGRMIRGHISAEAIQAYRDNASRPGALTAMLNWYRALRYEALPKQFPLIEVPTLLLWGDADFALSIRTTVGTENHVKNLTFRVLPEVSHWVQQEASEAVNHMLECWLTGKPVPEYRELPHLPSAQFSSG